MPTVDQDGWVSSVLGVDPKAGGAAGAGAGGTAGLPAIWAAAEKAVEADIAALREEMLAEYGDDPAAKEAEAGLETHARELLRLFDGEFASALQKSGGGRDEVRAVIGGFLKRVDGDATIQLFDGNPFVDVDIAGHLRSALGRMVKAAG